MYEGVTLVVCYFVLV